MTWRKLRHVLFSLIAVVAILLATISTLLETETGSRWVVNRLASFAKVSLGTVTGNLRSGLDIATVDYQQDGVTFHAEHLSFRWRPIDLFYSALMIDSLSAQNLSLQLPVAAPETPASEPFSNWPSLRLPLRVQLYKIDLRTIRFQQGERRLEWERLSGDISLGTFNLRYRDLTLIHRDYQLRLLGRTALDYPYASSANLHWQWQAPALPDGSPGLFYRGISQLDGDVTRLQLNNSLDSPIQVTANISGALVNDQQQLNLLPRLQLVMEWPAQALPAAWWLAEKAVPVTRGVLKAEGNWQHYSATLEGAIQLPDAPALQIQSQAQGDLTSLLFEQLRVRELGERLQPKQVLAAPLEPGASFIQAAIRAATQGVIHTTTHTATFAKSQAATASHSPAGENQAVANAQGEQNLSPNRAASLSLQGKVQWSPVLEWQLAVDAKAFNLAGIIDNWPSDLNATFSTNGNLKDAHWQAALRDLQIAGELRGVNVQGSGSLAIDGATLHSDELSLVVGANQIQLKGEVGDKINLQWNLHAPLLQQLDETVSGSITSKGELRGDVNQPRISITAGAEKFSWGSINVEKLDLALVPVVAQAEPLVGPQLDGANAPATSVSKLINPIQLLKGELLNERYTLNFNATRLRLAQQYFSSIVLAGSGSIAKHQLQATLRSPGVGRADLGLQGGYEAAVWQGNLNQLAIKLSKVPRWWLTSSKPVRISAQGIVLGEQCLTTRTNLTAAVERDTDVEREQLRGEWQPNQSPLRVNNPALGLFANQPAPPASGIEKYSLPRLCLDGGWSGAAGATADARFESVPLRQFLSLFKTEVFFAGVMDGHFMLRSPDLTLTGSTASLDVTTRNAELRYQNAGGTDVYPWRNFALNAQLANARLTGNIGLEWEGYGRMDFTSALDLAKKTIEQAKLDANFHNIAPLETLLPFTHDVKGQLVADLSLGGRFSEPYLLGEIHLRDAHANLTRLGVDLTGIQVRLNSTRSGTISFESEAHSGDGRITLAGDLFGFGTPGWRAQAFVNGSNFSVVSLPQLKATLSPSIKVTANAEAMNVAGDAVIPWARANFKSLPPSATQVSPDVVIQDDRNLQQEAVTPFKIYTNMNLSLGDDVSFRGFGLRSKLSGRLNLLKEAHRPFFTNGYVSVSEGSYKAYGQTLTIERGRLAFQGPYDDPGLDIRATRIIRDSENTKVGLDIDGTLQRPKAKVFSSPSRSDSEAMMMLLTGKPIKDASDADASLLLSAMSGLGMDSGGSITAEINRFFGVDQLEVKSDEGIDQSQLWVGKYLTPKLLVRYVVGIFDHAFSFGMEYQLTDNFRIEAESGETKSVDLIYKIER